MWIIPSNLPLSSRSALEYLGSSEDLKELASTPVSWPTWKSKPTSLQTWLRAWKRVFWIPHLFGRTLKPSMHGHFVEEYTASLAVIHVSEPNGGNSGKLYQEEGCIQQWQKERVSNLSRGGVGYSGFPMGQGYEQYEWEHPREVEPGLGSTVNGYNFREDLLRALGNSVVEQTAELAFIDLLQKHLKNV